MSKLFWMVVCLGAYLWVLTSGKDQFILNTAKALVESVQTWFDGAEKDFQLKQLNSKKKSRRWD
jgi:hypothetical protein